MLSWIYAWSIGLSANFSSKPGFSVSTGSTWPGLSSGGSGAGSVELSGVDGASPSGCGAGAGALSSEEALDVGAELLPGGSSMPLSPVHPTRAANPTAAASRMAIHLFFIAVLLFQWFLGQILVPGVAVVLRQIVRFLVLFVGGPRQGDNAASLV